MSPYEYLQGGVMEKLKKTRKRTKSREELESQARLSLPDVLQWFGWPRRTWNKKWKATFPDPRLELEGHTFWATSQVLEWESEHQFVARKRAGAV
jgi:hypothetical protein